MRIHWRQILAPAITLTTVVMILLFDRYLFRVPNPGAISFLAVAFSAYLGGIGAGLVSAAISVGFAAIHFSPPSALAPDRSRAPPPSRRRAARSHARAANTAPLACG